MGAQETQEQKDERMSWELFPDIQSHPVPRPENPVIEFVATEYRVPMHGEFFWADGDETPSVCRYFDCMDLSHHNGGQRWILIEKRAE